jgi:hypothetical protein
VGLSADDDHAREQSLHGQWLPALNDGLTRPGGSRPERPVALPSHRLTLYTARHWHAQLTVTHRGHRALEDAGLGVTTKTLINWLSESSRPATTNASAAPDGPPPCASTPPAVTGTRSRNYGRPTSSPTTSSRTTSSTTSSSPTSAKAPTDGTSPAPPTPSNSGSSTHEQPNTRSALPGRPDVHDRPAPRHRSAAFQRPPQRSLPVA